LISWRPIRCVFSDKWASMARIERTLAVICARGGSKGLPRKNLLNLSGRPLLAWTIEAAHAAARVSRTILSSEDPQIIACAKAYGCEVPFTRPAALAGDDSNIEAALFHALDNLSESWDAVVLLQPTSPLRTSSDIDACLDMLERSGAQSVISCSPAAKPAHWAFTRNADGTMSPLFPEAFAAKRRQSLPETFMPNGAVFAARLPWLRESGSFYGPQTQTYVMPLERSVDIDTASDFAYAQALLATTNPSLS
jgi:CMP-N,N'-diacetyllegionaminic acid synthase